MIELSEEQINQLYELRLVVYIEDAPQSDLYRQIRLTPKQFELIGDIIGTEITATDSLVSLPTNISSFYEEDTIEEEDEFEDEDSVEEDEEDNGFTQDDY